MAALNPWTLAWIVWLAAFAVIEGAAILLRGTTLSQQVWRWFAVHDTQAATRWRRILLALGLLWLSAHLLTGGQEWGRPMNDVLAEILKAVVTAAAPVIAGLVVAVLVQLLRKYNLDISADQQAKWENLIRRGLQWAEEHIAAQVKAGTVPDKATVTGPLKQAAAIEYVQAEAPNATPTKITRDVESKLAETPFGASESFPQAGSVVVTTAPAA